MQHWAKYAAKPKKDPGVIAFHTAESHHFAVLHRGPGPDTQELQNTHSVTLAITLLCYVTAEPLAGLRAYFADGILSCFGLGSKVGHRNLLCARVIASLCVQRWCPSLHLCNCARFKHLMSCAAVGCSNELW